jgi:antitoxin (DNA-binding transcriptional repressor) of toxin-antitoxin stability system
LHPGARLAQTACAGQGGRLNCRQCAGFQTRFAFAFHAAKTHLSQLLARGKRPVARLVPYHPKAAKRRFGALQGIVSVGPEFFEPLPEDELAGWER